MYSFFGKFNLLSRSQFGFREGYSTTLAISEFVESTLNSLDKGNGLWLSLGDHAFLYIKRIVLFFQLYIHTTSISGYKF